MKKPGLAFAGAVGVVAEGEGSWSGAALADDDSVVVELTAATASGDSVGEGDCTAISGCRAEVEFVAGEGTPEVCVELCP